ncbi:MAG: endonuclease MutS2 [Synechococcales cyanobacterium]
MPDIGAETLELLEWSRLRQHLSTFAPTKQGSRACLEILPWCSQIDTEQLLEQTQEAIELENLAPGAIPWQDMHPIQASVERVQVGGMLASDELLAVANTLGAARKLRRTLDDLPSLPTLGSLVAPIRTYPEMEQEIHRCIDEQGEIRDSASPQLQLLRQQFRDQRHHIYAILNRLMSERSAAIQESVITQRHDRYVIPIKASHRDQIPGLVHDSSSTGSTLFVEPYSITEANNRLRQLSRQVVSEEERICQELSQQVQAIAPDLFVLIEAILRVDLAVARARYSRWLGGNRPRFRPDLHMRQVRHPLLLWTALPDQPVTPIDFTLRDTVRVVVITGPNTGGKTVALKTLGLLTCMAKAGLFIPARDPVDLPWCDWVLADIGDEQSLEQNLSTFSGHIRRIQRIIDQTTESSLVLLDEVGAGTDPAEGAALATAILEYLADHSRLTLATTHYGELKALKYQSPLFENASVEFDEETLAPLYRLRWGIPGRSHAGVIAQRLGLHPQILASARQPSAHRHHVDVMIQGLEEQRRQLETRLQQADQLQQELETLHKQMQHRYQALQEKERQLKHQQHQGVEQLLDSARREIAAVIRRLQQGEPNAQEAQAASQALHDIQTRYVPPPLPVETEFAPHVGDRVRVPIWGQVGEILEYKNDDQITIRSGQLKLTVALNQLAPLNEQQAKQRQRPKPNPPPPPPTPVAIRTSQNTHDVRGKTIPDALEILEPILMTAEGYQWIIHGIGTGRLRAGIQDFLKNHPRVQEFHLAEPSDGGSGATVVLLRHPR